MSRSFLVVLVFCAGCSLDSRPFPGADPTPAKQLFHTDGGQGIAKLVGAAGAGGRIPTGSAGHAGTGAAGNPSPSQLPDAAQDAGEPQDATVDAPDAGADGATDAAQTPPDAAPTDAGTPVAPTPGKTCAPCTNTAATTPRGDCAQGYSCLNSKYGCAITVPKSPCPHGFSQVATVYASVACSPADCETWVAENPDAGF